MFNLFPMFGSPGDCASTDDFIGKPATNWFYTSTPTFTVNDKTYKADELSQFIGEILTENQKLKNELEGWKIGNKNWRKLYDEKADTVDELKNEIERLKKFENWHQPELCNEKIYKLEEENTEYKKGNRNWMNLYQEVVDKNNELLKEIKHLSYLKEKNVELIDRVNEIDSDQNEEYRAEIFTLKNECALLRAKNNTLQEFIDTKIKVDWKSARIDILERDLQKCAEQRDEFKHQLNAANKENEKLKKDIVDYVFEKDNQVNSFEEELKRLKSITKEEYDQIPVIGDTDRINNLLQKAKDLTEGVEVDLDKPLDEQCDKETSWEEAASDLALRVAKLEEQLKYTQKIICPE